MSHPTGWLFFGDWRLMNADFLLVSIASVPMDQIAIGIGRAHLYTKLLDKLKAWSVDASRLIRVEGFSLGNSRELFSEII